MRIHRAAALTAALSLSVAALAACGSDDDSTSADSVIDNGLTVVASFYPLQFVSERILGEQGTVTSLTKAGAEPHDLELTPQDVADVGEASLIVYLSRFQSAVDDAVDSEAKDTAFDAADGANLDLTYTPIEEGEEETEEAGATDPHFWLDPTRLADVSDELAQRLGELDSNHAKAYTDRAADLRADLEALDADMKEGLATCENKDLVTSHNAFGYLAQRYGLTQVGITGLTPEEEPSAGDLAAVTDFVKQNDVSTIYYETLISPAIAETVAKETGARTAVLDPLEGLNDESEGKDYFEVMRANLENLKAGQPCP